ncbi:MAG: hypothetical protein AAGH19_10590 [Pseudomonadota bacterium]
MTRIKFEDLNQEETLSVEAMQATVGGLLGYSFTRQQAQAALDRARRRAGLIPRYSTIGGVPDLTRRYSTIGVNPNLGPRYSTLPRPVFGFSSAR